MQTAIGEPDQIREAMAAGACGYVVKPYDDDTMWTAVRNALIIGQGET
jgi:DNA-binding NarL/FixJ family response regulator